MWNSTALWQRGDGFDGHCKLFDMLLLDVRYFSSVLQGSPPKALAAALPATSGSRGTKPHAPSQPSKISEDQGVAGRFPL